MGQPRHRTPQQLIQLYWDEVWNDGHVELIREICADPIVRFDVGSASTRLTHDEQIARVSALRKTVSPHFTHEVLLADDEHVVSVWNMISAINRESDACGIELFRAQNGRLVACWNAPYAQGRWGRDGDPSIPAHLNAPEVLATPSAISPEWLQKVFKAAGLSPPRIAGVYDVVPIGHGTTARSMRVSLAYNADAGDPPQSVVIKLHPADPDVLRMVGGQGCYSRELAAYRFLPSNGPFRIPKIYFADVGQGGIFNIVMEDLTSWGVAGDQIAGCTVAEAEAVMRACSALHLHYWADTTIALLDWPLRLASLASAHSGHFSRGASIMRANYGAVLGADLDIIDSVAPLVAPWYSRPIRHRTLLHGDPRIDNFMVKHTGDLPQACLLDLQQMMLGDPLYDLAYFLSGSLTPADRRANEKRFVHEHSAAIRAADSSYDPAQAWDRYRAHSVVGLMATVVAAAVISRSAHNDRLLITLAQRNCAAIRDLDGVTLARQLISEVPRHS